MKLRLLALSAICALITFHANAQHTFFKQENLTPRQKRYRQVINNILKNQSSGTTPVNKPTGIKQRVVRQTGEEIGNTTFVYSGNRGSAYDYFLWDQLEYQEDYYYESEVLEGYTNNQVFADSIFHYDENENLNYITTGSFGINNRLDSFMDIFSSSTNKDVLTYNNAGKVISDISYHSSAGIIDSNKATFTYNANNKILIDSYFVVYDNVWTFNDEYTSYHYNSANQLDSILFYGSIPYKVILQYYPSGQVKEASTFDFDDNEFVLTYRDSFGYTSGIEYPTYILDENYYDFENNGNTITPSEYYIYTKYPGSNGKPDSVSNVYYSVDEEPELSTTYYHYNSYGNPDTISISHEGEPANTSLIFYYEEYDDEPSAINNLSDNKDFIVYPNPFTDKISIQYKGSDFKGNLKIHLTDVMGKEVYNQSIQIMQGNNNFDAPALASGTYILTLQDADGKLWSTKLVKK